MSALHIYTIKENQEQVNLVFQSINGIQFPNVAPMAQMLSMVNCQINSGKKMHVKKIKLID